MSRQSAKSFLLLPVVLTTACIRPATRVVSRSGALVADAWVSHSPKPFSDVSTALYGRISITNNSDTIQYYSNTSLRLALNEELQARTYTDTFVSVQVDFSSIEIPAHHTYTSAVYWVFPVKALPAALSIRLYLVPSPPPARPKLP